MKLTKKYIRIHAADGVNLKISGGMEYFGNERPFWTNGQHSKNLQEQFNQDTHQKQRQPQLSSPRALSRFLNESESYCRRKLLSHHRKGVRIHQCLRTPSKNSDLSVLILCARSVGSRFLNQEVWGLTSRTMTFARSRMITKNTGIARAELSCKYRYLVHKMNVLTPCG